MDIEIPIEEGRRLVVGQHENPSGSLLVTVIPQYRDRSQVWRLAHSGLMLDPLVARRLAPALLSMAAAVDTTPPDPSALAAARDETRWG